MLREGMEAILVLVAIMAYLAKSGNKKYLGTVYNYSIAAVAASFITAYISALSSVSLPAVRQEKPLKA